MITSKQVIDFHRNLILEPGDLELVTVLCNDPEFIEVCNSFLVTYALLSTIKLSAGLRGCYISAFTKGVKFGRQLAELEALERLGKL